MPKNNFVGINIGIKLGYKTARLSYPSILFCCISNVAVNSAALQKINLKKLIKCLKRILLQ
jgi:hypothetical protein